MTSTNDLYRLVARIRDAELEPIDRELFRPLFAAFDGGQVFAVPEYVERRVRHYAGRVAHHNKERKARKLGELDEALVN